MYCTNCGTQLPDDALFCEKCGARIQKNAVAAPVLNPQIAKAEKPKKNGKVIAAILLLLALFGLGAVLYLKRDSFGTYLFAKKEEKVEETTKESAESLEEDDKDKSEEIEEVKTEEDPKEIINQFLADSDGLIKQGKVLEALAVLEEGMIQTGAEELQIQKEHIIDHTIIVGEKQYIGERLTRSKEYDEKGNIRLENVYGENGSVTEWIETTYDSDENKVSEICYYENGNVHWENEYVNGKLSKFSTYKSDGSLEEYDEYECDKNGNPIKQYIYKPNGKLYWWRVSMYDANGNKIKDVSYNGDGSISSWGEYEYDQNGNQKKYGGYFADGSTNTWGTYEYDDKENVIKRTEYDANGNTIWWEEYENDLLGNRTQSTQFYNVDGNVSQSDSTTYVYSYKYIE